MTTGTGLSERLRVPDVWTAHYVDTESGAVKREVTLDPLKAADLIDDLVSAAERYTASVKAVFAIDPSTKKCFAEGSPTKDQETYERFVELNNAGVALSAALAKAKP